MLVVEAGEGGLNWGGARMQARACKIWHEGEVSAMACCNRCDSCQVFLLQSVSTKLCNPAVRCPGCHVQSTWVPRKVNYFAVSSQDLICCNYN